MPGKSPYDRRPNPGLARAKIIQYPSKRPTMPGIPESQISPSIPDSRAHDIRAYLGRLLSSRQFSSASRRGQLLEYLVAHTLAGDAAKISEYAIGLEVFQRPTSFDPRIESQVRTEVSRLRQRLREYYAEEGRHDPIVIDFPPRSYVATFEFREPAAALEIISAPAEPDAAPRRRFSRLTLVLIAAAIAALAIAGFFIIRYRLRAQASQPINAIVVLPFQNYSAGRQDEYLADGLTEELTNDLAQWRDLRVVARTSAYAFRDKPEDVRQIGRELSVDAVLEGSFTRQGDRVRITAQLNRTSDGYHLWSHAYDAQANDLLSIQQDVAGSIATAIRQIRGGGPPPPAVHLATTSPKAHDLYLQAIFQYNLETPQSYLKAIQLFQQATVEDPYFARAYLGIGKAEYAAVVFSVINLQDAMPRIRQAAEKAIELDPNLGDAYATLASVDYGWDFDWPKADEEYRRAIELGSSSNARSSYASSLTTRGRFAEAHEQFRMATEQDPLSVSLPFNEFFTYNFERDFAGQKRVIARMMQINSNFFGAHALNVVMSVQQHDCATAHIQADWLQKTYPTVSPTQAVLAYAAACSNNKAEALGHIKQMIAMKAQAYQVAIAYALLHDSDNAIVQLNRSTDLHEGQVLYLRYDPFFDEIRSDPRYIEIEKRVGLIP